MAWEAWVVPAWEYPKVPAEVDFQSLLVPTVDSTRALAVIHHLQVELLHVLTDLTDHHTDHLDPTSGQKATRRVCNDRSIIFLPKNVLRMTGGSLSQNHRNFFVFLARLFCVLYQGLESVHHVALTFGLHKKKSTVIIVPQKKIAHLDRGACVQ